MSDSQPMLAASTEFENEDRIVPQKQRERETVFFHSESVAMYPVSSSRTFLGSRVNLPKDARSKEQQRNVHSLGNWVSSDSEGIGCLTHE